MSSNRNQQDASQREQRNQTLLLHIGINVVITSILFWLTINDDEPFIAPISQISMVLRWAVIAAVIAFLQVCWVRGWKRGARDKENISNCPDCHGNGRFRGNPCDHRRLGQ